VIKVIQGKYEKAKKHYREYMLNDFFEFHLVYASTYEKFRELDRFIWESKHDKTRFKNSYKGPVLIDITEWNSNVLNEYFDAFMYYLKDNPYLECTFIVQDICSENLKKKLEYFFEISIDELETRNENTTKRIGFYISEEAKDCVRS